MTDATLIARLEAATGADRELDAAIARAVASNPKEWWFKDHRGLHQTNETVPSYSASIDAALTLVPEGWLWQVEWIGHQTRKRIGNCILWRPHKSAFYGQAATPALAICIAALRARSEGEG